MIIRHHNGTTCLLPTACRFEHQQPKHRRTGFAAFTSPELLPRRREPRHRLNVPVDSPSLSTAPARHLRTV